MSAWICCYSDGKAAAKIVPPRLRTPSWTGLGAESEEKREPASDVEAAVVDSLKVLDPERPIREADMNRSHDRRNRSRMTRADIGGSNIPHVSSFLPHRGCMP